MPAAAALDLDFVRQQFPNLANGWIYFENAGGSYVPRQVLERQQAFMTESQVQPDSGNGLSSLAGDRLSAARNAMAAMINAQPEELVIGPSTTLNVYVLAQALRPLFQAGDEVVVTNQDHEANGGAWRRLDEFGLAIREWKIDPTTGALDPADLEPLLSPRTRLVCFPHVSNIVGSINPVAEITAKVREAGAMSCVDGVAYAAHRPIDVQALGADFYLFSLYKIYGPHIALLYARRERMAEAKNQNHYFHDRNMPDKLNPGGLNYEAVASLTGITDYFDAVYDHHFDRPENSAQARFARVFELFAAQEAAIVERFLGYIAEKPGVRVIGSGPGATRLPTFSLSVDGRDPAELAEALGREKIATNHGHFYAPRCLEGVGLAADPGVLRISMVHYNTLDEVDRLIEVLDALL